MGGSSYSLAATNGQIWMLLRSLTRPYLGSVVCNDLPHDLIAGKRFPHHAHATMMTGKGITLMLKGKLRFLFLGDSYTAGTAVPENLRWPVQLTDRIKHSGADVAPPRFVAGNGWTTKDLINALDAEKPATEFDFVFLLIGVNNQFQGRPLAEFETEFDLLVVRAIALARGRADRVFVLAVPDYSVTPFAADRNPAKIHKEITLFNKACVKIAAQRHVEFFNTVEISRQAGTNGALLVDDGLHPSEEMYRLWSDFVFTQVSGRILSLGSGADER